MGGGGGREVGIEKKGKKRTERKEGRKKETIGHRNLAQLVGSGRHLLVEFVVTTRWRHVPALPFVPVFVSIL